MQWARRPWTRARLANQEERKRVSGIGHSRIKTKEMKKMIEVYAGPGVTRTGLARSSNNRRNTTDRCREGYPKTHSVGQGSLLKAKGPQSCSVRNWQAVLWEQQPRSHLDTDTRARESGRRRGSGRRPTRKGQEPGTSIRNADSTGDKKNTPVPAGGHPPTAAPQEAPDWMVDWFGKRSTFL